MQDRALGRRNLLGGALWFGGLLAMPSTGNSGSLPFAAHSLAARFPLLRVLEHSESALVIGRACLANSDEAAAPSRLHATLLSSLALSADKAASLSRNELTERVRARVRADYSSGHTVRIDGWVLSRTEVRLAALVTEIEQGTGRTEGFGRCDSVAGADRCSS